MMALFRDTYDLFAGDTAFEDLVALIRIGCPPFEEWWRDHDVRTPSSGFKTLYLPTGAQRFGYITLQSNDEPALKVAIYSRA